MTDPWATPEPASTPEPEQAPAAAGTPAPPTGEVTVTLKGGTGFDAPWVVIHSASVEAAAEELSKVDSLKSLLENASRVGQFFARLGGGGGSAPHSGGNGGQNNSRPGAPAGQPAPMTAPGGRIEYCAHGEMTYREGVGKASGKAYKGFFCPERDRSNQCEPKYVR